LKNAVTDGAECTCVDEPEEPEQRMKWLKYGALAAIFSNLENETYVKEILSDVKDFIREIQDITTGEIHRSRDLIRPYTRKEMIHSDTF